jgi:carbamoyl-phosphate synthase large subunit
MILQLKAAMREVPPLSGGQIYVADRAAMTPSGQFADRAFTVPSIAETDYVDRLVDICQRHGVRVLVPLIDVDMIRLAPHIERFAEVGTHLVCPSPELVEICFDKASFDQLARAEGIPVPRRFTPDELDKAPYPIFCKPPRGFGSIGTGVCRSAEEARRALQLNPQLLFEEYVQDTEISVDCYLAAGNRCTIRVQRIRDRVVGGEAVQTRTVRIPEVQAVVAQVVDSLGQRGLCGPLNIQVFATTRPPVFDVNPRLGSASVLSNIASHGRLLRSVLAESCGLPVTGDPDDYQEGLHLYRFLGDLFHDGSRQWALFPGEWVSDPYSPV